MRTIPAAILLLACAVPYVPNGLSAQNGRNGSRPNVFFDCDGPNCRSDYYRTEITWVNWVRDRRDSDVHVIMTSVSTGPGGREYQLDFIGMEGDLGYEDQLVFQTLSTDTDREELDTVTHSLGLGLARFANALGLRGLVSLAPRDPSSPNIAGTRLVSQDEVDDPWNLWTFRIRGSGELDGEDTRETTRLNTSLTASRVTPTWKLNFNGNVNFNRVEFELEDGTFVDTRTDWGFNQLVAYALADHWSIGMQGQVARFTRANQDFRLEITPAIEYSVFSYQEATRRALTFFYKIGPAYRNYIEETIFQRLSETRFEQSLEIELSQREQWGESSVSITGSHFLHDFDRNVLRMRGDVEFRIVRGFSVSVEGNIAWIDDQIFLSAEGVSDEEALLRLQLRGSDFNYGIEVGFSFQFGSIFNNVVNNRFRGVGGFFGGG